MIYLKRLKDREKPAILTLFAHCFFDDSVVRASWLEYDKFRVPIGVRTIKLSLIHSMLGKFGIACFQTPMNGMEKKACCQSPRNYTRWYGRHQDSLRIVAALSVPEDNSREELGCRYLLWLNASSMTRFEPLNHSDVTALKEGNTKRDLKNLKSSRPAACLHVCKINLPKVNHHKNWHLPHMHMFFVIYKEPPLAPQPSSYTPETVDFDSDLDSDFGGAKNTRTLATSVSVKSPRFAMWNETLWNPHVLIDLQVLKPY